MTSSEIASLVAKAFKPIGNLRLYQLSRPADFRCVKCQQFKLAILVATSNDDWRQTLCSTCYSDLAQEQRQRRPKDHPKPRQAPKEHKPKEALAKSPKSARSHRQVQRRQQLENQRRIQEQRRREAQKSPAASESLAFFRSAGIPATIGRRGRLCINHRPTEVLVRALPSPQGTEWNKVIDAIAMKYAGREFMATLETNLHLAAGFRAFPRLYERGFAIVRDGIRFALIRASGARIPNRDSIIANFLNSGPHWQQLANVIHDAEAEIVSGWEQSQRSRTNRPEIAVEVHAQGPRTQAGRRIDQLPESLSADLAAACIDASQRIRLHRQLAYERPVILEFRLGELTLLPITGMVGRLEIPFRFRKGQSIIAGHLLLSDHDPLPLLISENVPEDDAISVWACALLGFAEATCVEVDYLQSGPRDSPTAQAKAPSHASPHGEPQHALPQTRQAWWPTRLEPVGPWQFHHGGLVAGHRRHLSEGMSASPEARDRARQIGINLGPQETWVRPHARGIPAGTEIRFRWHPPTAIDSLAQP